MKIEDTTWLAILVMLLMLIISFVVFVYFDTEPETEEIEVINLSCLEDYAEVYCNGTVLINNYSFHCIEKDRERDNVMEVSSAKYFLDTEIHRCTTLQLNFRETGR